MTPGCIEPAVDTAQDIEQHQIHLHCLACLGIAQQFAKRHIPSGLQLPVRQIYRTNFFAS